MSPAEAEQLSHRLREIEVSDPQAREGFADTKEEMEKARNALVAAGVICQYRQITPAQVKRFMVRLENVVMQSKGPEYRESCSDVPSSGFRFTDKTCRKVVVEFSESTYNSPSLCDISLRVYTDGEYKLHLDGGIKLGDDYWSNVMKRKGLGDGCGHLPSENSELWFSRDFILDDMPTLDFSK